MHCWQSTSADNRKISHFLANLRLDIESKRKPTEYGRIAELHATFLWRNLFKYPNRVMFGSKPGLVIVADPTQYSL